jgi:hypothetical protein
MVDHFVGGDSLALFDLLFEKASYFTEQVGPIEWLNLENLKIGDLNKEYIIFYNYMKFKYSAIEKNIKENNIRAFDALSKIIEIINERPNIATNEESLYIIFNDYYTFYERARSNSSQPDKAQEDMAAVLDLLLEETSKKF